MENANNFDAPIFKEFDHTLLSKLKGAKVGAITINVYEKINKPWFEWNHSLEKDVNEVDSTQTETVETLDFELPVETKNESETQLNQYVSERQEVLNEIEKNKDQFSESEIEKLNAYVEILNQKIAAIETAEEQVEEVKETAAAEEQIVETETPSLTEIPNNISEDSGKLEDETEKASDSNTEPEIKPKEEKKEPNKLLVQKEKLLTEIEKYEQENNERKKKKAKHNLEKLEKRIEKEKAKHPEKFENQDVTEPVEKTQKEKLIEQIEKLKTFNSDDAKAELTVLENQLDSLEKEASPIGEFEEHSNYNKTEYKPESEYKPETNSKEAYVQALTEVEELINVASNKLNNLISEAKNDILGDKEKIK